MPTKEDAAFYREFVDDMFERGVDTEISNFRPENVEYALSKMLGAAKHSARILPADIQELTESGVFNSESVKKAAMSLLSHEGATLTIVIPPSDQSFDLTTAPLLNDIATTAKNGTIVGTLEVRKPSEKAVEFLEEKNFMRPMVVVDEKAFRIAGPSAHDMPYVNFGNEKEARSLAGLFDDVLCQPGKLLTTVNSNSQNG